MQKQDALPECFDVMIIGAGPSGTTAAHLLAQRGFRVLVVEKAFFPRRVIGESLLPQVMDLLAYAGLLEPIEQAGEQAGFQRKEGALFQVGDNEITFRFAEGFSEGWDYTYQVKRDQFDQLLAEKASQAGVMIEFGHTVEDVQFSPEQVTVLIRDSQGNYKSVHGQFLLDASGYGRVLPRLLKLEKKPSNPPRAALFSHIKNDARGEDVPTEHVLITVHPLHRDVWYWLIPFSDGTSSIGISAPPAFLASYPEDLALRLLQLLQEEPNIAKRTKHASLVFPPNQITGYARQVSQMYGERFALLGNAGDFLDPIFSSGITIALKSAILAADALTKQLQGKIVDWEESFLKPLSAGTECFRTYVEGWYDGTFAKIIYYEKKPERIVSMLTSILAGYVWDQSNPFVAKHKRRYRMLAETCAIQRTSIL